LSDLLPATSVTGDGGGPPVGADFPAGRAKEVRSVCERESRRATEAGVP
jgi:hypothetical protein